jgi:hypothetical protein
MAAHKDGLIHAGRKVRRPPLVGVKFLHQRAKDNVPARGRLQARELIALLFGHFAAAAPERPRCRTTLRVITPNGCTAVKIKHS